MVSSGERRRTAEETRTEIFRSCRRLFEERGFTGAGMGDVAAAAGITRAGLYLHFSSKSELFVAFVGWIDEQEGLMEHFASVGQEPDPVKALDLTVKLVSTYEPKIHDLALASDAARLTDKAVGAAWDDRMASRRWFFGQLVERLANAGALRTGVTKQQAVDVIFSLTAVRYYDDLVLQSGWPAKRWVAVTQSLIHSAILR